MAEILFIRHGQASFGSANYDQLSELGYRQATLLGQHLLQQEIEFDNFYAGSLDRQQQTAQGVIDVYRQAGVNCPALKIDPAWDELDNHQQMETLLPQVIRQDGELEALAVDMMHDKKAFQKILRAVFQYWIMDQTVIEGLESWPAARQRFSSALDAVMQENGQGSRAAVFSSGGVIACITALVMKLGPESVYGLFEPVINASISRFIHNQRDISLSSFNEHQFLTAVAKQAGQNNIISYR